MEGRYTPPAPKDYTNLAHSGSPPAEPASASTQVSQDSESQPLYRPPVSIEYNSDVTMLEYGAIPERIPASQQESEDLIERYTFPFNEAKREAAHLVKASIPAIVSSMSMSLIVILLIATAGRLGTVALAGISLASVVSSFLIMAPLSGIAMALDTLCSQAYTAVQDRRLLGVYLQRALISITLVMACVYPLLWNSRLFYQLLGVREEVADVTVKFLRIQSFGVVFIFVYECLRSFLFAQNIRRFAVIIQLVSVPLGWLSIWLFLVNPTTSLGILGVALTFVTVSLCLILSTAVFAAKVDGYQCWGGWSRDAFKDLAPFLWLGAAGSLITLVETTSQNMVDLGAVLLGAQAMAAQVILTNITSMVMTLGIGPAVAVCNRVGNLLGAKQPNRTVLFVHVSIGASASFFCLLGGSLVLCKDTLPALFTSDSDIASIVRSNLPWVAAGGALKGFNTVLGGILRGQGRQASVAKIRTASFLAVGVPLSIVFTSVFEYGLGGLWFGFVSALSVTTVALSYFIATIDWDHQVICCQKHVDACVVSQANASESV